MIKRIDPDPEGFNKYYVRFYDDGMIDCEVEVNRFNGWHWKGPRHQGIHSLAAILADEALQLSDEQKRMVQEQFEEKPYSRYCVRQ